jgi:hypothetical protein
VGTGRRGRLIIRGGRTLRGVDEGQHQATLLGRQLVESEDALRAPALDGTERPGANLERVLGGDWSALRSTRTHAATSR